MNARTTALPPTIDDTMVWDVYLSQFRLPIVNTAIEAGVFRVLCDKVLTHEELAAEIGVDARALQMWLAALCADGFLESDLASGKRPRRRALGCIRKPRVTGATSLNRSTATRR